MSLTGAINPVKQALSTAPPSDAYLAWDAPGVEDVKADEELKAKQIGETMNKMQQHNFDIHRIVKGKLTVREDLPTHLQQGLFKAPGKTYDVAARYFNEPIFLQADQEPGPRGLSLRIFGVEGERLEGADQNATTQDFMFNNAPMIELTDIDTCLDIMQLREKYFDNPTKLSAATKLRTMVSSRGLLVSLPSTLCSSWAIREEKEPDIRTVRLPNTNMVGHSFYTQSAFRYGQYYGHMGLFPIVEEMKTRDHKVTSNDPRSALSDWLSTCFAQNGAKYEFRIQLGTDPSHPTEDGSVVWDEATAPYQTIAMVEFPAQESMGMERRVFWEGKMKLSPWDALSEHRPLGSINRLRRVVYDMSRRRREAMNAVETKRVEGVDEVP